MILSSYRLILHLIFLFTLIFKFFDAAAQPGCTDPQATNYDAFAQFNDGSCIFSPTNIALSPGVLLDSAKLSECSGIIVINGELWMHEDDGPPILWKVDSTGGAILQQVVIANAVNTDWEDIATDENYIYIGNFGNNYGSRTDLQVIRIAIDSIFPATDSINGEFIYFNYSDQVDFTPAYNSNSFDCEALIVYQDSLHLFTKDWVSLQTKHYKMPALPGNYIAQLADSFYTAGLVTGADIQGDTVLVLIGYNLSGSPTCFLWMFDDTQQGKFFSGDKRKFDLGSPLFNGQTEGIAFKENMKCYITNEMINQFPFVVPSKLREIDLSPFLSTITSIVLNDPEDVGFEIYPVPVRDFLFISETQFFDENSFRVMDVYGRELFGTQVYESTGIAVSGLLPGLYILEIKNGVRKPFLKL